MGGKIVKVSGPLVVAKGLEKPEMYEVVKVGKMKLFGEIIGIKDDTVSIQVYEQTEGIGPGEPVENTGEPLSVELGPGIIRMIYDGIQRPLDKLAEVAGDYLTRGISEEPIDHEKKWDFIATVKDGDRVVPGQKIGYVEETEIIRHYIMIPPMIPAGIIQGIKSGSFNVIEKIAEVKSDSESFDIKLSQKWPVRIGRPYSRKVNPDKPMITGQRVLDTFFPLAKGGTAAVPGPFGSGKTVVQHQLAKWADADMIVYVGCGERGNEMTDVLIEFPELKDPKTGKPIMERTVLIANTSNMPVAAREASVFTGITIAEYFRDMGYSVAMMADSTSRWAEAMREISGRLEEMPGEEGYPAYLASRIADFYERAGSIFTLGNEEEAALSVIGAVSPPGGDLSDPVVQATLREVRVFWGLDAKLAYSRHFPAINWLNSYSLYTDILELYFKKHVNKEWENNKKLAMKLLQEEAELEEIVRLVGIDALGAKQRLILEVSRSIREDFLHQNAFHDVDTYTSLKKQFLMMENILHFYRKALEALDTEKELSVIISLNVREDIARQKYFSEAEIGNIEKIHTEIDKAFAELDN